MELGFFVSNNQNSGTIIHKNEKDIPFKQLRYL